MPFGSFGIRRLLDAHQNFLQAGLPVYLRLKDFTDNPAIDEAGFTFVPSVTGAFVGTQDILIQPQPEIKLVSMHTLAMAQSAGVELRDGARKVTISHSWVLARQRQMGYSTPQQVFNDSSVVGIVSDNLLMEVVNMIHNDIYGNIVSWLLTCNTSELSKA